MVVRPDSEPLSRRGSDEKWLETPVDCPEVLVQVEGSVTSMVRSRLVKQAGWSFALKVSFTIVALLIGVLLVRLLGAHGYGIYAYASAVTTLLVLAAQAGLPSLVMRETARAMARDRPDLVQGVWRWAGRITGVLAVGIALLTAAVLLVWRHASMGTQEWTFAWAVVLVPLVALSHLSGAALQGLHCVVSGQLAEVVLRSGLFLLLIGASALIVGAWLTPPVAMALNVVAAAVALAIGACLLWRDTPPAVRRARPCFDGRTWRASAWPLTFMVGMQVVNNQTDILILGLFAPVDQVGIYRVAVQVAALGTFGLQTVNAVVAPRFAHLYAQGETAYLRRLVTASARVALAFNLIVTVFFVILGKPLLVGVFGPAFASSYLPLLILLSGQLVNSAAGSVGFLLTMTGHERQTARGMAIAAGLNIVLNLVLIPIWGTVGAATATATCMMAWNVLLWWAVHEKLGIDSSAFNLAIRRTP